MQDHGLFQATAAPTGWTARTRFGLHRGLTSSVQEGGNAIAVYTRNWMTAPGAPIREGGRNRLQERRERSTMRWKNPRTAVRAGGAAQRRVGAPALLLRQYRDSHRTCRSGATARCALQSHCFAGASVPNIADELEAAGYSSADIARIRQRARSLPKLRRDYPQGPAVKAST